MDGVRKRFMQAWTIRFLGLWLGLTAACGLASAAGGEQLYFVAQVAPVGSMTASGQQQIGVYLRWDVVEGALPADLKTFKLLRNGTDLVTLPAQGMMPDDQIAALYQGGGQQRRLLESLSWLREQAAAEQPPAEIRASDLPGQIRQRAQADEFWAMLASRVDFNIARARYRGYLDREPEPGVNRYELQGIDSAGDKVVLGQAEVDSQARRRVSAADDFRQVMLGQCDAPEAGKDHGVVALTWDHGGAENPTDRYANTLLITGYDLYRSVQPLTEEGAPPLDIAALAATSPHAPDGTPQLPDLERVNQQPIMIHDRAGLDPNYAQFMESAEDVAAAGLKPGDRRAYYLVPRDFTGNYGPSRALAVTVPDRRPPPAPWAVEVETHDGDGRFSLVWDAVNLLNYHRSHADGRQYCNLDSARAEGVLRYVSAGQRCGVDPQIEVPLDVRDYRVYRFESYQAAAAFRDSDGDGFSDADERAAGPAHSCSPALRPTGARNYLVSGGYDERRFDDGRSQILFHDDYLAERRSEVVWYRVASVGAGGQVSALSAPVRGHFPDRRLPPTPVLGQDLSLVVETGCFHGVQYVSDDAALPLARDVSGDARRVRFACGQTEFTLPLRADGHGGAGATPSASQCQSLRTTACDINDGALVFFMGNLGQVLGVGLASPKALEACAASGVSEERLELQTDRCGERAVEAGDVLSSPPTLRITSPQCFAVYREIDGEDYKIDTVCGHSASVDYGAADFGQGDMVCLSVAAQNDNARTSPKLRLPCFTVLAHGDRPAPPQPLELSFHGESADVVWQLPEERVTATVLEWQRPGDDGRRSDTVAHPGARGGEPRKHSVEIGPEPAGGDWQEEWCVRARVVGQALDADQSGVLSDWSAPLCAARLPTGQAASPYLPWPGIPRPPSGPALDALYLGTDHVPIVRVSEPVQFDQDCDVSTPPVCDVGQWGEGKGCLDQAPGQLICYADHIADPLCGPLRRAGAGHMGFVAYRQSRPLGGGEADDFVQVSPLIEGLYCSSSRSVRNTTAQLVDPYVKLMSFADAQQPWQGNLLVFVDRYPHVPGREYNYQFVYFSADGEIVETRTTPQWLAVPE